MKSYPLYKDSGVEWIGEIPSGWDAAPLKYACEFNQKSLGNNTDPDYELDYLEISDVDSLGNIEKPTHYKFSQAPSRCRRVVTKNDTIISTVRTYLRSIGFIEDSVIDLICSTGFCVVSPNLDKVVPKVLFYLIRTESFISMVISRSEGVSYPSIQSEKLVRIKTVIPPLQEQQQISNYLDHKTQKIDSLIEKTQQKIELLKEQRTALINQVVTKGLNPDVEMKDSGVEWIGEIPKGWTKNKLKYIFDYQKGFAFSSSMFTDNGIPVVKASDIKKTTIIQNSVFINREAAPEYEQVSLKENDIILTTVGSKYTVSESAVGQLALVPKDHNHSLLNQNTVRFRVKDIVAEGVLYIFYFLQTKNFRGHLDIYAHGTANQASLNIEDILNFSFFVPPVSEQQNIVYFLSRQIDKINSLTNKETNRIELLREYRQSLISEVVTGKVDVRDEVIAA